MLRQLMPLNEDIIRRVVREELGLFLDAAVKALEHMNKTESDEKREEVRNGRV